MLKWTVPYCDIWTLSYLIVLHYVMLKLSKGMKVTKSNFKLIKVIEVITRYRNILEDIGRYRNILEDIGRYRKISEEIGRYRKITEDIRRYRKISNNIERYLMISKDIGRYLTISKDIGRYQNRYWNIVEDLLSFGNLLNEWMLRFGKRFLKDNIFFDFLSSLAKWKAGLRKLISAHSLLLLSLIRFCQCMSNMIRGNRSTCL